uniref:Signal peptide peptidase SppA n=1 Tax=Candidatus Aschnera chinzeii TaxID=1485666 RepID=A0AAT9G3P3_9ENTR|nr:MAG: signal peptide peptidase SppA [Candidatus Aschnera chinzeii]
MHFCWNLISNFFKFNWKLLNYIKLFISNFINIIVIIIIINAGYYLYKDKIHTNNYYGALLIDLHDITTEENSISNTFNNISRKIFNLNTQTNPAISIFTIVNSIRIAINDSKITGIVLQLDKLSNIDQVNLHYIGKALNEFKNSGKPIYAVGNSYNQSQYYLASFANKIYMSNHGIVNIHGFATNKLFFKTFLEKTKINSHIFRVGTYKSAVEPFIRNNMSHEGYTAEKHWIYSLWQEYIKIIANNRHISEKTIDPHTNEMIKKLATFHGNTAKYAISEKLIDYISNDINIKKDFKKYFGWNSKNNHYNYISIYNYKNIKMIKNDNIYHLTNNLLPKKNIGVITIHGIISDYTENQYSMDIEKIILQIDQAIHDPNIKAVILRINSPGGSVTATEVIRAKIAELHEFKKPIIVSMENIAASGGYWIATAADYIIASSSTLTGSIGIFGIINTFEKSLEKLGIYADGIATTPLADNFITKGISTEYAKFMELTIKNNYSVFLEYVANARHKTISEVEKIAQGRIWTGQDALKNGLIDQIGDFDDAVKKASELGNIKNPILDWMQPNYTFLDKIIMKLISNIQYILSKSITTYNSNIFNNILLKEMHQFYYIHDPQNCYAYCINCLSLQ